MRRTETRRGPGRGRSRRGGSAPDGRARGRGSTPRPGSRRARARRHILPGKVLLSVASVMIAAALVGVGTFATFTDTASVSQVNTTGTITLAPINVSQANNRLSIGATNIAAGDTIERAVNVKNTGTIDLANVVLTTSATVSSLLNTDTTNGLQMVLDRCSVAWTEAGAGPPYTYTCSGTTSAVLTTTPVIGTNLAMSNIVLTAGSDNFLRVKLTLPSTAPNTLQGQSSTIQYSFTATQRAATTK